MDPPSFAPSRSLDNLRIVLVSTRNPLNIGAAARAMSNFGAPHLRVVHPYEPSFREARSAVGAADLLATAEQFEVVADAVADCQLVVGTTAACCCELQHDLRRLEAGARIITQRLKRDKVALLFGSEKVGLSNEDFDHCHWLMRIPTRAEHGSMNLSQSVAICLYELVRETAAFSSGKNRKQSEREIDAGKPHSPARAADLHRLTLLLFEVLESSGYVKPRVASATEAKLRRMVRRLDLSIADAELWLGMLRQIQWKLKADR